MNLVHHLSQTTGSIGVLGGIVGGTAAAAANIKSVKNGEISQTEAAIDVGKETLGAGVATAAAAFAATEPAKLPVEAQATVLKPNSTALDKATATTRSLNDRVG